MYTEYSDFEQLKQTVECDKQVSGLDAYNRDRYPIRFVLLANFRDCSQFVDYLQTERQCMVQSVDKWIDPDYPDLMLTHTELAQRMADYIRSMSGADCVIAPFSELARFYDNDETKTFDALLKTIKGIEASRTAFESHQRVYIPIVGLEGKMESFRKDSQSVIWQLRSEEKEFNYRLILSDADTFGVTGLESHYTVVHNIREWLNIWKDADKQVTPNIICSSRAIFANAEFAQPDNAFSFVICNDAYEFLTMGLQLQLGGMSYTEDDAQHWAMLASSIDITHGFTFSAFVKDHFMVNSIVDLKAFMRLWLEYPAQFDRWLLSRYYQLHNDHKGYLCAVLDKTTTLSGNDFIEQIALYMNENESDMNDRRYCLKEAVRRNIVLREGAQITLAHRLEAIAAKYSATSALRYLTGITRKEQELAISWLAKGQITIDQLKDIFPDLYHYAKEALGVTLNVPVWLEGYMQAYKTAKIENQYSDQIATQIQTLNASEVTFDCWYQDFSTVRTLLQNRGDIEVFYWIDGLGIEWIPLIKQIIAEKKDQALFLNEVKIARALLPTITSSNKADLQKLLPAGQPLEKAGDLDALAHQPSNLWPSTIIQEIEVVRTIIEDILQKYVGKKIAIISDHGLSYLPQLCDGLGLTGVTSDHHGRIAVRNSGAWTTDDKYLRLEDGRTTCALRHTSLCSKVPKGQGAHGGCTPEEVLVPIFVISSFPSAATWTAELLTLEISGTDPHLRFCIKNAPSSEMPVVEYNSCRYKLQQEGPELFVTDTLALSDEATQVDLVIGDVIRSYTISIQTGVKEDDPFASF